MSLNIGVRWYRKMSIKDRFETYASDDQRFANLRIAKRKLEGFYDQLIIKSGLFEIYEDLLGLDPNSSVTFTEGRTVDWRGYYDGGSYWILSFGWRNNLADKDRSEVLRTQYWPMAPKWPLLEFSTSHFFLDNNQLESFELMKETLHFKDLNKDKLETTIFDLLSSVHFGTRLRQPHDFGDSNVVFLDPKNRNK